MADIHRVAVRDAVDQLLEVLSSLCLGEVALAHNLVEELPALDQVHDQVQLGRRVEHRVQPDDVRVVEGLHDGDFPPHVQRHGRGVDLRLVHHLDGALLPRLFMDGQLHPAHRRTHQQTDATTIHGEAHTKSEHPGGPTPNRQLGAPNRTHAPHRTADPPTPAPAAANSSSASHTRSIHPPQRTWQRSPARACQTVGTPPHGTSSCPPPGTSAGQTVTRPPATVCRRRRCRGRRTCAAGGRARTWARRERSGWDNRQRDGSVAPPPPPARRHPPAPPRRTGRPPYTPLPSPSHPSTRHKPTRQQRQPG